MQEGTEQLLHRRCFWLVNCRPRENGNIVLIHYLAIEDTGAGGSGQQVRGVLAFEAHLAAAGHPLMPWKARGVYVGLGGLLHQSHVGFGGNLHLGCQMPSFDAHALPPGLGCCSRPAPSKCWMAVCRERRAQHSQQTQAPPANGSSRSGVLAPAGKASAKHRPWVHTLLVAASQSALCAAGLPCPSILPWLFMGWAQCHSSSASDNMMRAEGRDW